MLVFVSVPTAATAAPTIVGEATWPGFNTAFPDGGDPTPNAAPIELTATLSEAVDFDWFQVEFPHKFNGTSIDEHAGGETDEFLPLGGLNASGQCIDGTTTPTTLLFTFTSNVSSANFDGTECFIYTFDGGIGFGVDRDILPALAGVSSAKITVPVNRVRQISDDRDLDFFTLGTANATNLLSALPLAFATPPLPEQGGEDSQSTSLTGAVVRESAIHLKLLAKPGDPVSGATVEVVGTDLPVGSNYQLTLRSTPTVLINEVVRASRGFSALSALPSTLETGNHSLTLTATSQNGSTIQLVQHFTIAPDGTFTSVGETHASGLSLELLATTGPSSPAINLGLSVAVIALLAGVAAMVARRHVLVGTEQG